MYRSHHDQNATVCVRQHKPSGRGVLYIAGLRVRMAPWAMRALAASLLRTADRLDPAQRSKP